MKRGIAFVMAAFLGVGIGCASSQNDDLGTGILATDPADGGAGDSATKTIKVPAKSSGDDDDSKSSSSSSSSSSSGSAGDDDDQSSSSSSSSGSTPPPPVDPCGTTTCATAKKAGSVSGDTAGSAITISGATSKWFTLDVTEDDKSLTGVMLHLRSTLTSPANKNFDLFVYLPDAMGTKECSANVSKSEKVTGDDKVSIGWGEGSFPNAKNDTRTVSIEVREIVDATVPPVACDPAALWTLKLEGNH